MESLLPDKREVRVDYRHFGAARLLLATLMFLGNLAPEPLATYEFGSGSFTLFGFVAMNRVDHRPTRSSETRFRVP